MQVGVTGGIGAGKSLVCRIFGILGIPVYDADTRAKQLMEESEDLRKKIAKTFGPRTYNQSGKLDRGYLAQLVFSDNERVQELNALVHPAVGQDYAVWATSKEANYPYVIKEAALLIESGSYQQLDYLISVVAPVSLRMERILTRDPHRDRQQIESIMSKQLTDEQRIAKSDIAIFNDEQQPLLRQVLDLHKSLVQ